MKKIILPMFALTATAMLLPSCSSDDIVPQGGDATVILTAKLPDGLQTRAFADGKTATHLQMVVMQAEGDRPYGDNLSVFDSGEVYTAEFQNGKLYTEVPVKLVSGKRYAVICWADAGEKDSPYEFNTTTHTVTANYANRTTSDETLDAFYACTAFTVEADGTQTIELRRPFAQLNIGTDDLEVASKGGFTAATAEVTVPVSTQFNLVDGEVNEPEPHTFTAAALPTSEKFPASAGEGYQYLAMNYVLTSADKTLADEVKLKVSGTGAAPIERTFNTVPLQRNYRTNIYGSILTNVMNVKVVIEPDFFGEFNSVASFDALFDQLNAGGDVQLTNDVIADKVLVVKEGTDVTLDMNSKTLANTVDLWNDSKDGLINDWSLVSVRGGNLTVGGNGNFYAKANDVYAVDVQDGGTLVIKDGYFKGNVSAVYVYEGSAVIEGGTFEIQQLNTNGVGGPYDYMLNLYDANRDNGTASITVKGGEFINFNPADCKAEGAHTNFLAPGYISVKQPSNDGKDHYVVMYAGSSSGKQDLIFGKTIDYCIPAVDVQFKPSAENTALTMAAGGEIKGVKGDYGYTSTISVDKKNTTINGTGGIISANSDMAAIVVTRGASLTIDGNNTYTSENGAVLDISNGTTTPVVVNVKGGHFTTTGMNCLIKISAGSGTNANSISKLYIQGGVFDGLGELINFGYNRNNCTVELSGGIFVGYCPADKYLKSGYTFNQIDYNGKVAFEVVPK